MAFGGTLDADIDLTPHVIPGQKWRLPLFAPKHRPKLKAPPVTYYNEDQVEHLIRTRAKRVRLRIDDLNINGKPWRHLGSYERDMVQKFGHTSLQVLDDAGEVLFELHGFPSDKRRPHDSGKLWHSIKAWAMHPRSMHERAEHFQHYASHTIGPQEGYTIDDPAQAAIMVRNVMRTINRAPVGYVVPHKPVHTELHNQVIKLGLEIGQTKGFRRMRKRIRRFFIRQGLTKDRTSLRLFSPRRFTTDGDAVGGNSNNVTDEFLRAFRIHKKAIPDLEAFRENEDFTIPKASVPLVTTVLARRAGVAFFSTIQGAADRPAQSLLTATVAVAVFGNNPNAPDLVRQLHTQMTTIGNPQNLPVFAQYAAGEVARHTVTIKMIPAILLSLWHLRKTGSLPDMTANADSAPTFDI